LPSHAFIIIIIIDFTYKLTRRQRRLSLISHRRFMKFFYWPARSRWTVYPVGRAATKTVRPK